MSQMFLSDISSDDIKCPINIIVGLADASLVNADTIKKENDVASVTSLDYINVKEEPMAAVDESDAKFEVGNFDLQKQEFSSVKVGHIVDFSFRLKCCIFYLKKFSVILIQMSDSMHFNFAGECPTPHYLKSTY